MKGVLVVNGPNLNLLGSREPEIYGRTTLADIEAMVGTRRPELGGEVAFFQSNSEGELLDFLQREAAGAHRGGPERGAPSPTTRTLSTIVCRHSGPPVVEVHLSNHHARVEREDSGHQA